MTWDSSMTRRQALAAALASAKAWGAGSVDARQATGVKVGEVTPSEALIWTRHTAAGTRRNDVAPRLAHGKNATFLEPGVEVHTLEGSAPGAPGEIRVIVEPVSGRGRKISTKWMEVGPENDYVRLFRIEGLQPASRYRYSVETRSSRKSREAPLLGGFGTAPAAAAAAPIRFALSSCQCYARQDQPGGGFHIYDSIRKLDPQFLVSCGDNVYYDTDDPIANSVAVARYHWQRMYSLPSLVRCLRDVPAYWQKDDHDVYSDDAWPGRTPAKLLPFRYEDGAAVFREQTPTPAPGRPLFRRFRWGRELEIWLPEARDYRSPNTDPDGPEKTIWGAEQKKWIQETLANSDAAWKLMINPNPIVGPDHSRKTDNHSNPAFAYESRTFRKWLKDNVPGQVLVMNGDRHWQYHSVDPDTGLHEWGCGAASDAHSVPPSGGEDKRFHKFLRPLGGFVTVSLNPEDKENNLVMEHRDVMGKVVYRYVYRNPQRKG